MVVNVIAYGIEVDLFPNNKDSSEPNRVYEMRRAAKSLTEACSAFSDEAPSLTVLCARQINRELDKYDFSHYLPRPALDILARVGNSNYAAALHDLRRFEEARSLMRKTMPVARRVLGDSKDLTLRLRWNHADMLYKDPGATLDDLREAVTTLEDAGRIARRVLGAAHPTAKELERLLPHARAELRARETPPPAIARTA